MATKITDLPTKTTAASADLVLMNDVTAAADKKVTVAGLASAVAASVPAGGLSTAALSNPYKFSAYRGGAATQPAGLAKVDFDTEIFDTGSNYDNVTNFRFTAPIAGYYFFRGAVSFTPTSGTGYQIALYKNGSIVKQGPSFIVGATSGFVDTTEVTGLLSLSATDYVEVYFRGNASDAIITGLQFTSFEGFLVSVT